MESVLLEFQSLIFVHLSICNVTITFDSIIDLRFSARKWSYIFKTSRMNFRRKKVFAYSFFVTDGRMIDILGKGISHSLHSNVTLFAIFCYIIGRILENYISANFFVIKGRVMISIVNENAGHSLHIVVMIFTSFYEPGILLKGLQLAVE